MNKGKPMITLERMGKGHALTISLTYKILPDELDKIKDDENYRVSLCNTLSRNASEQIQHHVPNQLKKAKVPA